MNKEKQYCTAMTTKGNEGEDWLKKEGICQGVRRAEIEKKATLHRIAEKIKSHQLKKCAIKGILSSESVEGVGPTALRSSLSPSRSAFKSRTM